MKEERFKKGMTVLGSAGTLVFCLAPVAIMTAVALSRHPGVWSPAVPFIPTLDHFHTVVTSGYVTHNQTEAMTLGDRIGLFKDGRLVQTGTPRELYESPRSAFAGAFIGSPAMNLLPARLEERAEGPVLRLADIELPVPRPVGAVSPTGDVRMGIRPEHLRFCPDGQAGSIAGTITAVEPLGREELVHVRSSGGQFSVLTTEKGLSVGATVHVGIDRTRVHLFGADEQGS